MRTPVFAAALCCSLILHSTTAFLPTPPALAGRSTILPQCSTVSTRGPSGIALNMRAKNDAADSLAFQGRRGMLRRLAACGCGACLVGAGALVSPGQANALAQIAEPTAELKAKFDIQRNSVEDEQFACGMATGMEDYELTAETKKKNLFAALVAGLPRGEPVVAELGMGSFPNAKYLSAANTKDRKIDLIGIDPNDKMAPYARRNARKAGLLGKSSLRIVHGVAEAIPLETASCDAVVCTLTLCSVADPAQAVAEIRRVLKPGGKFLFWEHVLSETDPDLARSQKSLTAWQVKRADGCHLDRRTLQTITAEGGGFKLESGGYFDLEGYNILNPTAAGIAV